MFAETILSAVLAAAAALTPATKCPPPEGYPTAGPFGLYVVGAAVDDPVHEDAAGAVRDAWGFEWYYYDEPDLYDGQRVTLIVDGMGTPDDLADDVLYDILYSCPPDSPCHED